MMFNGQEDGVKDNAKGDYHVKEGIIDDSVKNVLGLKPTLIVKATWLTARTISIITWFCKTKQINEMKKFHFKAIVTILAF